MMNCGNSHFSGKVIASCSQAVEQLQRRIDVLSSAFATGIIGPKIFNRPIKRQRIIISNEGKIFLEFPSRLGSFIFALFA
jgi:hypothetical protein